MGANLVGIVAGNTQQKQTNKQTNLRGCVCGGCARRVGKGKWVGSGELPVAPSSTPDLPGEGGVRGGATHVSHKIWAGRAY